MELRELEPIENYRNYHIRIMITDIKAKIIKWLEHVSRMKTNTIPKAIFGFKLEEE